MGELVEREGGFEPCDSGSENDDALLHAEANGAASRLARDADFPAQSISRRPDSAEWIASDPSVEGGNHERDYGRNRWFRRQPCRDRRGTRARRPARSPHHVCVGAQSAVVVARNSQLRVPAGTRPGCCARNGRLGAEAGARGRRRGSGRGPRGRRRRRDPQLRRQLRRRPDRDGLARARRTRRRAARQRLERCRPARERAGARREAGSRRDGVKPPSQRPGQSWTSSC